MDYESHFSRIKDGANSTYTLTNLASWVEKNIRLEGNSYSFEPKYGFQRDILNDNSRVNNTVKPAQIGLTTVTMAYVLAALATQKKFHAIYALPTANDAAKLVTTKFNPLIMGSPALQRLVNRDVNSLELKEVNGNFVFVRGTKSETAALSISADCLVADEVDRCDPDTLKQFRSRLQASEHQIIRQFSTPTIEGVGISKETKTSKRFRHFAKCVHCGNLWLPNFFEHIVIPGFTRDIKELDSSSLKDVRWQDSRWNCPSCGQDPELHPSNLQWVCENPLDNYEAHSHFVTPVTACLILKPAYLVRTSTEFNTKSEWANQVLGETSEDTNTQLTATDLEKCTTEAPLDSSEVHVLGADMGLMCAVSIGRVTQDGTMIVVHREMVPLVNFRARRQELIRKYRVVSSVHDAQPYRLEVADIIDLDPNAYSCMFTTSKSGEMYTLTEKLRDDESAKLYVRMIKTNRTMVLDELLRMFKEQKILMHKEEKDFTPQYLSLKRTQVFSGDELQFVWQKTGDEQDHMHFSLLYLYLAWKMRTRSVWGTSTPPSMVRTFKVKSY